MVGSAGELRLISSTLTEGALNLAVDFRLLLLTGSLALGRVEVGRFGTDGLSALQKGGHQRRVADSTMKTHHLGTPSGYFSRRRRIISELFKFALRHSLWGKKVAFACALNREND